MPVALRDSVVDERVPIERLRDRLRLFGELDANLNELEKLTGVIVQVESDDLVVSGSPPDVTIASAALEKLVGAAASGSHLTTSDVQLAVTLARQMPSVKQRVTELSSKAGGKAAQATAEAPRPLIRPVSVDPDNDAEGSEFDVIATTRKGRAIRAKTIAQRSFINSIGSNTITLGYGPAGTGKTFLAVVMAMQWIRTGKVHRIVLSRPAVEAGEKLGFLPGPLQEKVDPYMRPLIDALGDLIDPAAIARSMERMQIEVAPLGYMRGRTLSDAFVVLDEAQNATRDQLKMFLTRLGANSKMVAIGDITQVDLPRPQDSGLVHAVEAFKDVEDVGIVELTEVDVVRHPLIRRIVEALGTRRAE